MGIDFHFVKPEVCGFRIYPLLEGVYGKSHTFLDEDYIYNKVPLLLYIIEETFWYQNATVISIDITTSIST